jgi:hypothetical protein
MTGLPQSPSFRFDSPPNQSQGNQDSAAFALEKWKDCQGKGFLVTLLLCSVTGQGRAHTLFNGSR